MDLDFWKLVTILIAGFATYVAYQQFRLGREKYKLDLFEKRFSVFAGARRLLSSALIECNIKLEYLFEFRAAVAEATFLFEKDITDYLDEIDTKALSLSGLHEQMRPLPAGQERSRLAAEIVELSISDIVRLAAVESGDAWYKRLNGSFSLGYSYTKANDLKVLNLSADIHSRDRVRRWEIALDSQVTSQASDPSSQRSTLTSSWERFMPDRYYLENSLEFTRNDELGLALRSQVRHDFRPLPHPEQQQGVACRHRAGRIDRKRD